MSMSTGLARVTISAPHRRVDVALPEQTPLVELLPEVLRHAGEGLADSGEEHGGWVLRRADGGVLATARPLAVQGVRDGEVLHLVPAQAQWPQLEYDDVVEAIADGARRRGGAWSPSASRTASSVAAGLAAAVGLLALLAAGPAPGGSSAYPALGIAALLTVAGVVASRAYGDAGAGVALAGCAMPYAFAGGALLVTSGDPVGLPGLRWIGAAELLAGSAALVVAALLGTVGVAAGTRIFVAATGVGLGGAAAALTAFALPAQAAAAVVLSVLVLALGVLPLLAIRLGKVPMPPVAPADDAGPGAAAARRLPDTTLVRDAVTRSEEVLGGLLIAQAVLVAGASAVLVAHGGTAALLLVAACAVALLLRTRLFVAVRHRVPLLAGGLAGVTLLGAGLAATAGDPGRLLLVAAAVAAAPLLVAAGATYAHRPPSPYLGRAADLLETVVVVSVVPVACAVLDLYARARGLIG